MAPFTYRSYLLGLVLALISLVTADVQFTTPSAGATVANGAIDIAWRESGSGEAISTFATYSLFLMVGGNAADTNAQIVTVNTDVPFTLGSTSQAVFLAAQGGSARNAYFFKMISVSKEGGTVINYSRRFTISGMTGSFPAGAIGDAARSIGSNTASPPTENNVADNANAAPAAGQAAYTVPYSLQQGLTRYAPMQVMPATKITKKKVTPPFPTSAYVVATTFMPPPTIVTTLTQSKTFSVSSGQFTAAAAQPLPTAENDMQKFLRRWAD